MIVGLNIGKTFVRPSVVKDVASTKIYNDDGQLIVIAIEVDGCVMVSCAGDEDFEMLASRYGCKGTKTDIVDVLES